MDVIRCIKAIIILSPLCYCYVYNIDKKRYKSYLFLLFDDQYLVLIDAKMLGPRLVFKFQSKLCIISDHCLTNVNVYEYKFLNEKCVLFVMKTIINLVTCTASI